MKVTFDVEQLKKILTTFYAFTNITITLFDSDLNCITFAGGWQPYCMAIGRNEVLHEQCLKCNRENAHKALKEQDTLIYTCHAGIVEVVAPIFSNGSIIAYIMLGEFRDAEAKYTSEDIIIETAEKYGLNKEEMLNTYRLLPVIDKEHIYSIITILKFCIEYMLFGKFLQANRHTLSLSIERYIESNLNKKITVETLCKEFQIERHTLYQILKSDFNDTVQNIINRKRIERAQELLHTTDMPVHQIASLVGFNDYSYFSQFFKKNTGVLPLQYRKTANKT